MVICELRQTPGRFNRDTISGAYTCSGSPTEICPQSLIGGTCDALLCVSNTMQSALESGQEGRIVQINFSAAFERVNRQGILYKLCSVGSGASVLSTLTQFLLSRSQYVMVDSCQSKLVNVVSYF